MDTHWDAPPSIIRAALSFYIPPRFFIHQTAAKINWEK
jgi:hypothetical protein